MTGFAMLRAFENLKSAVSVAPTCPRCKQVIPSEDVNVGNDIAYCRSCNLSHRLSTLTLGTALDENVDVSRPPSGTWFQREVDGLVLGATHRSLGQAVAMLFICLFWNGIVSVFVAIAVGSTLHHLAIPLPSKFPAPMHNAMPVGMTIFLWLFLTPFIGIGLTMIAALLSSLAGRTEIRIRGNECLIFNGVGPLGFTKRVSTTEIKDIRVEDRRWRDSDGHSQRKAEILIETESRTVRFGSMFTPERRQFVAAALRRELVRR